MSHRHEGNSRLGECIPANARRTVPFPMPTSTAIAVQERHSARSEVILDVSASTRGRPWTFPLSRADASPERTLSRVSSRSNSAMVAKMPRGIGSSTLKSMLWKTNSDGATRRVRLIDGLAFKTPYLFKYEDLIFWWDKAGRPKSIRLLLKNWWWELFHTGCKHNAQEVRRWQELGAREISGVSLCPVRFYLPWGLLVVMTRAEPLGRKVSLEEDHAARQLIGRSMDTGKTDTFGIIVGRVVVVDYGWWDSPPAA